MYFKDEWRSGLKGLRADTMLKLKKALPDLEKEVCIIYIRAFKIGFTISSDSRTAFTMLICDINWLLVNFD